MEDCNTSHTYKQGQYPQLLMLKDGLYDVVWKDITRVNETSTSLPETDGIVKNCMIKPLLI